MKGYKEGIKDNIYLFNWLIYADCSLQDAINHYCKFYKIDPWTSNSSGQGNFFGHTSLKTFGIWFKDKKPNTDVIAHEVFHAIVCLGEKLKTPINEDTEELFAYYNQMLFREICRILRIKGCGTGFSRKMIRK